MRNFKGVVFYLNGDGRIGFSGGLDQPDFQAADHHEAFRRLTTLQGQEILDTAFEMQVIEIFPEYSEDDSAYFGEREALNLRSALQKSALIEDASAMRSVEDINLERAHALASEFGLNLRLDLARPDTSPTPDF